MNVNQKYLKDENGNIISPIVSTKSVFDYNGTALQDILNRVPHIYDSLGMYEDWDSVVTTSVFQCIKFTNVYTEAFDKKGAPTNAYRWGLLISIITTTDHSDSNNYTNVQIYIPDEGRDPWNNPMYMYLRAFTPKKERWGKISLGSDTVPSYGY